MNNVHLQFFEVVYDLWHKYKCSKDILSIILLDFSMTYN